MNSGSVVWTCGPAPGAPDVPINMQVFSSSGLYVPTPGMVSAIVECWGGGGGGGPTLPTNNPLWVSGGGGAGGYSRSVLNSAQIGASQPVTVGFGGQSEQAGGATSFGSMVVAYGGAGANPVSPVGGFGAPPGVGQMALRGNAGGSGTWSFDLNNVWEAMGGQGGVTSLGGVGQNLVTTTTVTGGSAYNNGENAAPNSGAGGGGATEVGYFNVAIAVGGVGGSGLCVVTEFGV